MPARERGIVCDTCTEMRWFDPTKQADPGCPCGTQPSKRANNCGTFGTPIDMFSIGGVEPHEQEAFHKACPDVELGPDNVPRVTNRRQKMHVLRHFDWEEKS